MRLDADGPPRQSSTESIVAAMPAGAAAMMPSTSDEARDLGASASDGFHLAVLR
jgi:hypothetical protein